MSDPDKVTVEEWRRTGGSESTSFGARPDAHRPSPASVALVFRHRLYERDELSANLGIGDAHKGLHQPHAFRCRQEIRLKAIARDDDAPSRVGKALKEELDGHAEGLGDLLQAARADAVGAPLVFVYLLESDPECFAELFLAHANNHAPHPYAAADVTINPIGLWHLLYPRA